ncbi:MAG: hypothetical protein COV59_03150 [Candidatus Magasanikbacteria bacterium CG11_big_fil_rev_8_21_14_0_20_39_34]|uniref:Primosomal protein N n=1 Tax=Candidatus Magasanikbacteria bacterium CG11_big_fil_rev_8_21_14_0_20_39_34 TaxID=1974653 RepID=A0A2H0N7R3_9BACT|nr:MAG: hypothetical protein COV59_03150 [Candidatus Magasanikbacteria bacterium CG11_big_fil_rev_8_21_14_0_20_39_34]
MLVEILPLRQVPRALDQLTYRVPKELLDTISVGQIVKVPFRKSFISGLVLSLHSTDTIHLQNIKDVDSIICALPLLNQEYVLKLQEVAKMYSTSAGDLVKKCLPPLQVRKLKSLKSFHLPQYKTQKGKKKIQYHYYSTQQEHANFLKKASKGKTLIIIPETFYKNTLLSIFQNQKNIPIIFDSSDTTKQLYENWFALHSNESNIIIGLRNAVFLPLYLFDTIIVDYEHEQNHKHWDQKPRFHVKDVLDILSPTLKANIHYASFCPSVSSYHSLYNDIFSFEKKLSKTTLLFSKQKSFPCIIDMKDEKRGKNFSFFSEYVQNLIFETEENLFFYLNRKGFARSVGCSHCDNIESCAKCHLPLTYFKDEKVLRCNYCQYTESFSSTCKKCKSSLVELQGVGIEMVESELKRALPDIKKNIIRIDSNTSEIPSFSDSRNIVVGTARALGVIDFKKFDKIIILDLDRQMLIPEYMATENMWSTLCFFEFFSQSMSKIIIQTHNTQHFLLKSLQEKDRFYRTELLLRKETLYPPYIALSRYFYGGRSPELAYQEAKRVYDTLKRTLTETRKSVTIIGPIEMQPRYFRNQYWYCIIAKMTKEAWENDLPWLNAHFPPSWKVDPNPISLLSP